MSVIQADNLSFTYGANRVLRNVSFTVEKGEFVGIIGPNGGGKTTLLYLLMSFLKPDSGSLEVLGSSPKQARKKIGWVPQNFLYDRHFPITVLEVVLMGRLADKSLGERYEKADHEAALHALERLNMSEYRNMSLAELSSGQAQRVFIARALASQPQLLLLDEPTSSIDMASQEEVYKILKGLKEEMTIMMVTHDLRAVSHYVGKIFCVQREMSVMSSEEVCEHFAMGLYHTPLKEKESL